MRCVSSVRYSVKVNGEMSQFFTPKRGLRQGDPISPYLFLLCADGLSCLMKHEEQASHLKGLRNGVTGPAISHLLFVDDNIFFKRVDDKSINTLKNVLQTYSQGPGQRINLQKSSLYFGYHCRNLPCTLATMCIMKPSNPITWACQHMWVDQE
jgi:hypothetical protein